MTKTKVNRFVEAIEIVEQLDSPELQQAALQIAVEESKEDGIQYSTGDVIPVLVDVPISIYVRACANALKNKLEYAQLKQLIGRNQPSAVKLFDEKTGCFGPGWLPRPDNHYDAT